MDLASIYLLIGFFSTQETEMDPDRWSRLGRARIFKQHARVFLDGSITCFLLSSSQEKGRFTCASLLEKTNLIGSWLGVDKGGEKLIGGFPIKISMPKHRKKRQDEEFPSFSHLQKRHKRARNVFSQFVLIHLQFICIVHIYMFASFNPSNAYGILSSFQNWVFEPGSWWWQLMGWWQERELSSLEIMAMKLIHCNAVWMTPKMLPKNFEVLVLM